MPSFSFVSFIPLNCTPQLSSPRKDGAVCPPGPWEIGNSVYFPSQWNDKLSGRGILVLKLAFLGARRPVCQCRFQHFRLADGMTSTEGTFVLFAGNLFFFFLLCKRKGLSNPLTYESHQDMWTYAESTVFPASLPHTPSPSPSDVRGNVLPFVL